MIRRINLIEKKAFSFTYLKLMQICMGVIVVCILVISYKVYHVKSLDKQYRAEQIVLRSLEEKKDQLLKKPAKKKVSVGQYQDLLDKIQNTPKWSSFFDELGNRLPNTVWITKFSSATMGVSSKKGKVSKDKNKKKETKKKKTNTFELPKHRLVFNGLSKELRTITEFTKALSDFRHMENVTLEESNKESFGFSFKIKSEIVKND